MSLGGGRHWVPPDYERFLGPPFPGIRESSLPGNPLTQGRSGGQMPGSTVPGHPPQEQLGYPQSGRDTERGTLTAAQHSEGLAQNSEQQPLYLVGCQPSNTPEAKTFPYPNPDAAHARAEPDSRGSCAQGQWELAVTLRPCQGRLPRRKYINMCPNASRSSLRLCSAWKKKDMGMFPLQPPSLSLPDPAAPQVPWTTSRAEEQ